MKEIIDSGNLKVRYFNYDYFLDLLKNNKQFNYSRVQHALADVLIESYSNFNELINDIESNDWGKIAKKVVDGKNLVLKVWHDTNKSIVNEFAAAYQIIYENNSLIPNMHLGVSAGIGFGMNSHGNLSEHHPTQKKRANVLDVLTKKAPIRYHAGLPRHMGVMGEAYDFFKKLNELDIDVVLYGPEYMEIFKEEFGINKFHHFKTLPNGEIGRLETHIPEIINYSLKLDKPFIINSTGHIISQILAYNLKDTNISNFDIGVGFNLSLKNYQKRYPNIKTPEFDQPEDRLKKFISKIR